MPQLDITTLFSQVFWLLFCYFLVFFIILCYFLSNFSKLFKLRLDFSARCLQVILPLGSFPLFYLVAYRFLINVKQNLLLVLDSNLSYYRQNIKYYNGVSLVAINLSYVSLYNYNVLKYGVYKRLYL